MRADHIKPDFEKTSFFLSRKYASLVNSDAFPANYEKLPAHFLALIFFLMIICGVIKGFDFLNFPLVRRFRRKNFANLLIYLYL